MSFRWNLLLMRLIDWEIKLKRDLCWKVHRQSKTNTWVCSSTKIWCSVPKGELSIWRQSIFELNIQAFSMLQNLTVFIATDQLVTYETLLQILYFLLPVSTYFLKTILLQRAPSPFDMLQYGKNPWFTMSYLYYNHDTYEMLAILYFPPASQSKEAVIIALQQKMSLNCLFTPVCPR